LISSEGYWSKSTPRFSPTVACSRPFSSVPEKSGEKPRIEIMLARPSKRWVARPGRRERLSAMLASGNLPMSSAEIASTISLEFFLVLSEFSMLPAMPVTITASRLLAALTGGFFAVFGTGLVGSVVDCPLLAGLDWAWLDASCAKAVPPDAASNHAAAQAATKDR